MKPDLRFLIFACGIVFLVFVICVAIYTFIFRAPVDFPAGSIITVQRGESLNFIAEMLESDHIVRSKTLLMMFAIIVGREEQVTAGDYYFPVAENVYSVAKRITSGDFRLLPTRVTIPEGSNTFEVADIIKSKFKSFNEQAFLIMTKDKEGYLFPDTYFFMPSVLPEDVVGVLSKNFNNKIASIQGQIDAFEKPLSEVVTMASILEGEARLSETRRIVAGILWKRIAEGMPLQVDATFKYINGKTSDQLTLSDLKIDSPYNTYRYRGLPPTPISNPGLDTIVDAINPVKTPYYFFLTDKEGVMHYAKTLKEHKANETKYLR